uniref:4-coumarate--CoA ligase n=1 Tax=Angomonas desouzai TaxID=59800 RepID=T1YRQ8_9TRYP|nr:4-coumarate--CoA ligase [Angomonas desouzai]
MFRRVPLSTIVRRTPFLIQKCFTSKLVNGERIYVSDFESILDKASKEKTLFQYIERRIKEADPKSVAAVQAETEEHITYGELLTDIERVAQMLYHDAEIRKGDGVCIAYPNHYRFGSLVYGTMRLGAVVSTVSPASDADSLHHYLIECKAKALVGIRVNQKVMEQAVDRVMRETNREVKILYPQEYFENSSSLKPIPKDYEPLKDAKPNDTIFVPFSSGTTGLPKGVQLTNYSLTANVMQASAAWQLNANDTTIAVLPFFHIYGFTTTLNMVFASHARQVVMSSYALDLYMNSVHKYKATVNNIAPPIAVSMLKNAQKYKHLDLTSMTMLRCGAAPLTEETELLVESTFPGCSFAQTFGTTETSPIITCTPRKLLKGHVYGSSGPLVPDTEVRVIRVDDSQQSGADKSSGEDVGEGEEGEIWVRGPQLMKGYLKQSDTDKCMQDGWYRTGDIGRVDTKTGDVIITDRLKELIKYKGFQVSPAALEGVLLDHPWVEDCIVIGVTDPRDVSFESPRALIVLKSDLPLDSALNAADRITNFIMKRVPPHQRLHGGVRIVKEIPKNPAGKLLRRIARQQEIEYLKTIEN